MSPLSCTCIYFWALYSIPLVYLSIHAPVPYCFNYRSFIVCFNIWIPKGKIYLKLSNWSCSGPLPHARLVILMALGSEQCSHSTDKTANTHERFNNMPSFLGTPGCPLLENIKLREVVPKGWFLDQQTQSSPRKSLENKFSGPSQIYWIRNSGGRPCSPCSNTPTGGLRCSEVREPWARASQRTQNQESSAAAGPLKQCFPMCVPRNISTSGDC